LLSAWLLKNRCKENLTGHPRGAWFAGAKAYLTGSSDKT
jgi:hypothetical protein